MKNKTKFPHNTSFNKEFDKIQPPIQHYPYVGKDFDTKKAKRILVFAHNIAVPEEKFNDEITRSASKSFFADTLDEFTYIPGWWTKPFRAFLKGATELKANFDLNSDKATLNKVDSFVQQISYTNFIDGIVKSNKAVNAKVPDSLVKKSTLVNYQIIDILNISHCICWGKVIYEYIKKMDKYKIEEEKDLDQKGFSYCLIRKPDDSLLHVLRVYHPSFPSFKPFGQKTHEIFSWFFKLK